MKFCFYKFNNDWGVNAVGKSLETWLILMVCRTVQVKTHFFCTFCQNLSEVECSDLGMAS